MGDWSHLIIFRSGWGCREISPAFPSSCSGSISCCFPRAAGAKRLSRVWWEIIKVGFRPPADESLLFRQKEPKPFPPVRGPSDSAQKQVLRGPSASAPNKMARELAPLKQLSPKSRFGAPAPPRPMLREATQKTTPLQTVDAILYKVTKID